MVPITASSSFSLLLPIVLITSFLLSQHLRVAFASPSFLPTNISGNLGPTAEVIDFDSIDPSQIPASVPSDSIIRDRSNYLFILYEIASSEPPSSNCNIVAFDTRTNEYSSSLKTGVLFNMNEGPVAVKCHSLTVSVVNGTFVVQVFGDLNKMISMGKDQFTMTFDENLKAFSKDPDVLDSMMGDSHFSFTFSKKVDFPSAKAKTGGGQYFFAISSPPMQETSATVTVYKMPWVEGKMWISGTSVLVPSFGKHGSPYGFFPMFCGGACLAFDNVRSIIVDDDDGDLENSNSKNFYVLYTPLRNSENEVAVARLNVTTHDVPSAKMQSITLTPYLNPHTSSTTHALQTIAVVVDSLNSVLLISVGNQNLFKLTLRDDGIVDPTQLFAKGSAGSSVYPVNKNSDVSSMLLLPDEQLMMVMVKAVTPVRLFTIDYSGEKNLTQENMTTVDSSAIATNKGDVGGILVRDGLSLFIFGACYNGQMIQFSGDATPAASSTTITTTTAMVTSTTTPSTTTTTLPPERKTASRTVSITETLTTTMTTSESTSLSISPARTETTTSSSSVMPAPTPMSNTSTSTTTPATTIPSIPSSLTSTETPLSSSTTTTTTSLPTSSPTTTTVLTNPPTTTTTTTGPTLLSTSSSSSTTSTLVPSTTTSSTPTETTTPSSHHGNNHNHNSSKNDDNDKGSRAKTTEIAGGVAAAVAVLLLGGFFLYRMNRNKQRSPMVFDDSQLGDNLIQDNDTYHNQNYGTV